MKEIANQFILEGDILSIEPYGNGHINRTYLVKTSANNYILQGINSNVFKTPLAIIANIELLWETQPNNHIILPMMSTQQGGHSVTADEVVWRIFPFAEGYTSYEFIEEPWQAEKAANAYATFMKTFANIDTSRLQATIPNFHNGHLRFQQLEDAHKQATPARKEKAKHLYEFAQEHKVIFDLIQKEVDEKRIPIRITHNDTKINNVLINKANPDDFRVIDLEALCKGFSVMNPVMTEAEKAHIVDGAKYMIFIIGIRFLADYFNNDIYFKTSYPEENYIRARNQFVLLQRLEDKEAELRTIARKYFK